jgi:hypothetical protein
MRYTDGNQFDLRMNGYCVMTSFGSATMCRHCREYRSKGAPDAALPARGQATLLTEPFEAQQRKFLCVCLPGSSSSLVWPRVSPLDGSPLFIACFDWAALHKTGD